MNNQIINYVQQMEAILLMQLAESNESNLLDIASDMIAENEEQFDNVCQAYEVVKHDLLG